MKTFIITIFIFLSGACAFAQVHQRWDVKTLTDGFVPDTNNVKKVTVKTIHAKEKTRVKDTQPRLNFETQIVSITGTITTIKLEGDGDYHIEISDNTLGDSTFVCEAVDPANAITLHSAYINDFKRVRIVAETLKVGDKITFTGILFQDKYHKPSPHRTRNFLEMHPILKAEKDQ